MFDRHYEVVLADTPAAKAIHYRIRYHVYCLETGFEDKERFPNGLERDDWDNHATHFIVRSRATGEWIGAMRIVTPTRGSLPVQHLCRLDERALPMEPGIRFGELSRLCILDHARRRLHAEPTLDGVATLTPAAGQRRQPEILLGLLRAAAAFSRECGITHWFYMTTAALARSVQRLNIHFQPIGPSVQHRGDRYPFLAEVEESMRNISSTSPAHAEMIAKPSAYRMFSEICAAEGPLAGMPETDRQVIEAAVQAA